MARIDAVGGLELNQGFFGSPGRVQQVEAPARELRLLRAR